VAVRRVFAEKEKIVLGMMGGGCPPSPDAGVGWSHVDVFGAHKRIRRALEAVVDVFFGEFAIR
jgi:hypothetical protein